jgi:hypothetical protein
MARATTASIGAIIELDATISLIPFITVAHSLVDEIAVSSGHDEARLALIETWLAAHFYTVRDPRTTQETAGNVSATYQSAVALGLATSHYGQMAMTLDTSGLLAMLSQNKRRIATISWAGVEADRGQVAEG